jgi:AcrR family transcriptional regulator
MTAGHVSGEASRRRVKPTPVERARETLSPTARRILDAAKQIVVEHGLNGLTLDAIARAAGVNKAATHYHFGSKAGLIEALVDEIVLDECAAMAHDVAPGAGIEERIDSLIAGVRRMAIDPISIGGWWDLLPYAVRTPELRTRLAALYEIWFQWNLEWAGLATGDGGEPSDEMQGMGTLLAAIVDGIAAQVAIAGPAYDPEPTLKTLRHCLTVVLASAGSTTGSGP